jgi:hypothetical protein
MRGDGLILGNFVVLDINEENDALIDDGRARKTAFEVTFGRVTRPRGQQMATIATDGVQPYVEPRRAARDAGRGGPDRYDPPAPGVAAPGREARPGGGRVGADPA